jgi:tetratricopeptide (TPR) repeat protein
MQTSCVLGFVCFASAVLSASVHLAVGRPRETPHSRPLNIITAEAQAPGSEQPEQLYRNREDLASAQRAADLWATHAATDFESAWKLSRASYWLGMHAPESERRGALERGVSAGESAARIAPGRPEGHFWLAANMGALAESFGLIQGLKYRGKIKDELERVLAIDPAWQGGSADAALGQWYFEVPRILGGSRTKAEEHLRRALTYDPRSRVALSFLAEVLAADSKRDEARALLQRVLLDPSIDTEWLPEDNDFKKQAAERLKTLGR